MSTAMAKGRPRSAPRKTALTRERIVDTALAIADRDGLTGLTIRAVADALDAAPMSLYHHIANKEDLLQEISDAAMGKVPSFPSDLAWHEVLLTGFRSVRATLLVHPSLGQLYFDRPLGGPNIFVFTDAVLAVLVGAGFEPEAAVNAFTALCVYTFGAAVFETARVVGAAPVSADRRRLDGIRNAELQGLHTLAAAAPFLVVRGTETQFEYGLGHLIDGLRADLDAGGGLARTRRAAPRPSRADR